MKCEICKKADAKTVIHKEIDGKDRELYVCRNCAMKEAMRADLASGNVKVAEIKIKDGKITGEAPAAFAEFAKFLESALGGAQDEAAKLLSKPVSAELVGSPCPCCGMTMQDFSEKGRLGCPHCYEAFANQLASTIAGMHPLVSHVGKNPTSHVNGKRRGL